ncbi:hypothetical protein RI367_003548 [Sorochytrium milnesiophthora]
MSTLVSLLDAFTDGSQDEAAQRAAAARIARIQRPSATDLTPDVLEQLAFMVRTDVEYDDMLSLVCAVDIVLQYSLAAEADLALRFVKAIGGLETNLASHMYLQLASDTPSAQHLCLQIAQYLHILSDSSDWTPPAGSFASLVWTMALDLLNLPVNQTSNTMLAGLCAVIYRIDQAHASLLEQAAVRRASGLRGALSNEALAPRDVHQLLEHVVARTPITAELLVNVKRLTEPAQERFRAACQRLAIISDPVVFFQYPPVWQLLAHELETCLTVYLLNPDVVPVLLRSIAQELAPPQLPSLPEEPDADAVKPPTAPKPLNARSPRKPVHAHTRLQPMSPPLPSRPAAFPEEITAFRLCLPSSTTRLVFALLATEVVTKQLLLECTAKRRHASSLGLTRLLLSLSVHELGDTGQMQAYVRSRITQSLERVVTMTRQLGFAADIVATTLAAVAAQEEPQLVVATRPGPEADYTTLCLLLAQSRRILSVAEQVAAAVSVPDASPAAKNHAAKEHQDKRLVISAPTHALPGSDDHEVLPAYLASIRKHLTLCRELALRRYDKTLHQLVVDMAETLAAHLQTMQQHYRHHSHHNSNKPAEWPRSLADIRTMKGKDGASMPDLPALRKGGVKVATDSRP